MNRASLRLAPQDKLVLHPQFSAYMSGKKIYPVNVEISPSGVCQASCDFCWYAHGELGGHQKVFLETSALVDLLRDCAALRVKSVTWTGGGEPTLYPGFETIVRIARVEGLQQGLFTNALAWPKYEPEKLEWIRVTMTDKPFNEKNIAALRACKTLGFAFNYAGRQDDEYLVETLKLAERVHADYVQVRPALKCHGETVDIVPPRIDHPLLHVTEYKFEQAKFKHPYKTCEGYHFTPFVWEDGNVDVCAYMRKHDGYRLGNLYKRSFKDIMDYSPDSVAVHDQCQVCCKLHETNQTIKSHRILEDVNFP